MFFNPAQPLDTDGNPATHDLVQEETITCEIDGIMQIGNLVQDPTIQNPLEAWEANKFRVYRHGVPVLSDVSALDATLKVQQGVAEKIQALYDAYKHPNNPDPYFQFAMQ